MSLTLELEQLDLLISNKQQEFDNTQKELEKLRRKRYSLDFENRKNRCKEIVSNFINKHGDVLDKPLHDELRKLLVDTLYEDKYYVSSYDLVLRLILNKLDIVYEYLNEKKDKKSLQLKIKLS